MSIDAIYDLSATMEAAMDIDTAIWTLTELADFDVHKLDQQLALAASFARHRGSVMTTRPCCIVCKTPWLRHDQQNRQRGIMMI